VARRRGREGSDGEGVGEESGPKTRGRHYLAVEFRRVLVENGERVAHGDDDKVHREEGQREQLVAADLDPLGVHAGPEVLAQGRAGGPGLRPARRSGRRRLLDTGDPDVRSPQLCTAH
jgi:hypothetical protein